MIYILNYVFMYYFICESQYVAPAIKHGK